MAPLTVFLDSNVLFAIAWSGPDKSRSFLLYELQGQEAVKLFISRLVMEETLHNVTNKKIEQRRFLEKLLDQTIILPDVLAPDINPELALLPVNDRIILATAIQHRMEFFLTGNDRDFFSLYGRRIKQTLILKPSDFLLNPR